ncbi:hypothetical protein [Flaviaesturariibacter terrae]
MLLLLAASAVTPLLAQGGSFPSTEPRCTGLKLLPAKPLLFCGPVFQRFEVSLSDLRQYGLRFVFADQALRFHQAALAYDCPSGDVRVRWITSDTTCIRQALQYVRTGYTLTFDCILVKRGDSLFAIPPFSVMVSE